MNKDFPRILALLRKERKLSQKKAAEELGIGQALLSHYERGQRECGLAFLVKVADYYNVSTDYLLGRTASTNGKQIEESDIPEISDGNRGIAAKSITATLAKKMILTSIDIIYSLLVKTGNSKLLLTVTEFLSSSIYTSFRLIHRANPKNDPNIFGIKEEMAFRVASAERLTCEGKAVSAIEEAQKELRKSGEELTQASITNLEAEFGKQAIVLMSLIQNCEKSLKSKL
ncbi:MAG: helix-turn-helix transcriptional regulator [Oscillospiraceae bacterium]|nr:helix-turn-helix transcriptional regulator [Oscillospiraceae bacterium]